MSTPAKRCPNCAWAMGQAEMLNLPQEESWILTVIAENVVGPDLHYHATMAELSRRTRIKPITLSKHVKRLADEKKGCLKMTRSRDGYRYTLLRPPEAHSKPQASKSWEHRWDEPDLVPDQELQNLQVPPEVVPHQELQNLPVLTPQNAKFDSQDPPKFATPSIEESLKVPEGKEDTSLRSVACASAPATPETTETNVVVLSVVNEAQQVVEAWNAMAQAHDLPRLRVGETARRKAAALIRKNGIADVLRAIEAVGESPLCTGATTGWRADFYFLNQAVSFERLLSGFYADHPERVRARAGTQAAVKQKFNLPTYQPRFDPEPDDIGRIAQ